MSTRHSSVLRERRENQTDKKYYRQILKGIEHLQSAFLTKLQRISQNTSRRSQSSTRGSKIKRCLTPKSQNIANNRSNISLGQFFNQNESMVKENAVFKEHNTNFQTPKKTTLSMQVKTSPFNQKFNSPFDQCVFDTRQTVRKISHFSSNRSKHRIHGTTMLKGQSPWQKQLQNMVKQEARKTKKLVKQSKVGSNGSQNDKEVKEEQQGAVKQLQEQFQSCLLAKKKCGVRQQKVLRDRMTELSYRLAKIRQKQLRFSIY